MDVLAAAGPRDYGLSVVDTLGTAGNVLISEVFSFQGGVLYTSLCSWDHSVCLD